jgi:AcrR family transcriptional regulator
MPMNRRARTDEAKDERRGALISAALDEFFEKGFAAARLDDIAGRAGVSKGAIYLYFESKEALFQALIESVAMPKVALMEGIAAAYPSGLEALQAIGRAAPVVIRESNLPRLMKVLISDAMTFPEIVRDYRRNVIDRVLGMVAGILERSMKAGEIRRADPKLLARLVVAPIAVSGIWHVIFGADPEADVDLDALFALHVETMTRALSVKEAKS